MVKEVGHLTYGELLEHRFKSPLPSKPKITTAAADDDDDDDDDDSMKKDNEDSKYGVKESLSLNALVIHHHIPIVSR
jgi:hypothetical protein